MVAGEPAADSAERVIEAPRPVVGPPLWLLMELTYKCPLHCVFCYNPTDFATTGAELARSSSTAT